MEHHTSALLLNFDPFAKVSLPKQDFIQLNNLMNIPKHQINISQLEEIDYIEDFEKKQSPLRKSREEQSKQRRDRLFKAQSEFQKKIEEQKKQDQQRIDIEFSRRLAEQDRLQMEKEMKDKQMKEEQERKVLIVQTAFPQYEYGMIEAMLVDNGWNQDSVLQYLRQQNYQSVLEEEQRELMTLQLIENYQQLEYDQARNLLIKCNWNYDQAVNSLNNNQGNQFKIFFVMLNDSNMQTGTLQSIFDQNDDAMAMVRYLTIVQPIQDQYYKIYRDIGVQREISYFDLTNTFRALNIQSGSTFYVKKDSQPPF